MMKGKRLRTIVELWSGRKGELAWHVIVFVLAVSVAVLPAYALARESVYDQVESDRSIFGEGTITSHDYWFPDSPPGSTVYQNMSCTSEWLGDGNYRVLIRSTDMEYLWGMTVYQWSTSMPPWKTRATNTFNCPRTGPSSRTKSLHLKRSRRYGSDTGNLHLWAVDLTRANGR